MLGSLVAVAVWDGDDSSSSGSSDARGSSGVVCTGDGDPVGLGVRFADGLAATVGDTDGDAVTVVAAVVRVVGRLDTPVSVDVVAASIPPGPRTEPLGVVGEGGVLRGSATPGGGFVSPPRGAVR